MLPFVHLDPDRRMGADHGALAALDTGLRIPHRDFERDVTLLPLTCGGRISTVRWKGTHRNLVSVAGINRAEHPALVVARLNRKRRQHFDLARGLVGNVYCEQAG